MSISNPLVSFAQTQCLIQIRSETPVCRVCYRQLYIICIPLYKNFGVCFFRYVTSDSYLKNWIFGDKMFISITTKELNRMCNPETFFLSFLEISEYQKKRGCVHHDLVSSEYVTAYSLNSTLAPRHNVFCHQFRINFPTSSYKSSFEVLYLYRSSIMALNIQMWADE